MDHLSLTIPSAKKIREQLPLNLHLRNAIDSHRTQLKNIISGTDNRPVIILGPCSIHNIEGTLQYAEKIVRLIEASKEQFFICMRVYCEKPRSSLGWKGFLNDPHLDGSCDIKEGIFQTRKLFLELTKMGIPIATEFLDPFLVDYKEDLVTWGSIGARTCTSQVHRVLASRLDMPVGIKNDIHGDIRSALFGIEAAASPHEFIGLNLNGTPTQFRSGGNGSLQLVLRGGYKGENYDLSTVSQAQKLFHQLNMRPSIIIDCAHGNADPETRSQQRPFRWGIHQILEGNNCITGFQLESYLSSGKQDWIVGKSASSDLSITDKCMDWEETEELLFWAKSKLTQEKKSPHTSLVFT